MSIGQKQILHVAIPVLLIWVLGLYATGVGQESLRAQIERTSREQATELLDQLNRGLHTRAVQWAAYGKTAALQEALTASNEEFDEIADRDKVIAGRDRIWNQASAERSAQLMTEITDTALSDQLHVWLQELNAQSGYRVFGEVFVTNRYGVNVAQTNLTSDYRQDDEAWWQEANARRLHFTEVGYDKSAGVYSTAICIRIDDGDGRALGVLKAVLNIEEVIDIIDFHLGGMDARQRPRLVLLNRDLQILHSAGSDASWLADGRYLLDGLERSAGSAQVGERLDPATGVRYVSAHAVSPGRTDFPGLGWTLVRETDSREVLRPVSNLRDRILYIASCATVLVLAMGRGLAWSMARRLRRLAAATREIRRGNLGVSVSDRARDEVAQLAGSFNQMADSLRVARAELDNKTTALETKNVALEHEIAERRRAESERDEIEICLRQTEQLRRIGRLASSVAHEINTPTQFVSDNVQFLAGAFTDLNRLLGAYRDKYAALGVDQSDAELAQLEEEVELDYLLAEVPLAIQQSQDGLARIADIVRSMKEFSQPCAERKPADLNQAIRNTLTVARNEWSSVAEVKTDLDPELPLVSCALGEVNQVLLNLVVNAAHALAEITDAGSDERGRITITSRSDGERVELRIADNGPGIPTDVQERIFDPFFTTKPVGQGTGQGLAIARSIIVDRHHGELRCESKQGEGAAFVVFLPLRPEEDASGEWAAAPSGEWAATSASSHATVA